jgi:hypothetical protein
MKYTATHEFQGLKLGQIGTVTNLENGVQWPGEYYMAQTQH